MEKVPALGYNIVGLPTAGLQRRLTLSNLALPFKLVGSMVKARRTLRTFRPDVVVGFGGYASGPILKAAQKMGIPTLLQEQSRSIFCFPRISTPSVKTSASPA